jgi:hypothetical protein
MRICITSQVALSSSVLTSVLQILRQSPHFIFRLILELIARSRLARQSRTRGMHSWLAPCLVASTIDPSLDYISLLRIRTIHDTKNLSGRVTIEVHGHLSPGWGFAMTLLLL